MYPLKWQWQNDLKNNLTPVITRALLLVLVNIKCNVKLNDKLPSKDKAKVADSKRKQNLTINKPPKHQERLDREALFSLKETWGAHIMHNTKECR